MAAKTVSRKIAKNIKFEEALAELEAQVRLLESGELALEQSLEVYKYAMDLSMACKSRLDTVKQEVEKIAETVGADGGADYKLEKFADLEVE